MKEEQAKEPVKVANICPTDGEQCFNRVCGMTHEMCMKKSVKRNEQGYIVEDLTKWKPSFIGEVDKSIQEEWQLKNWRSPLGETGDYDSGTNLIDETGKIIAILTDDCDEDQANLIESAADMFKEIQELKAEVKEARNAALSEAIEKLSKTSTIPMWAIKIHIEILEGLKIKP